MKIIVLLFLLPLGVFAQGSFDPPAGQVGSLAIHKDSSIIVSWASSCKVNRGYINITRPEDGKVNYGTEKHATGFSDNKAISLGDGGRATLSYNGVVFNGAGADFCVFENAFDDNFLELAFVEVSSDGQNFVRFKSVSETPSSTQKSSFDLLNATHLYNLAGKYKAQYGTPFDLEELKGIPSLNIDSITHIRIVDVVGSVDTLYGSKDSTGNMVNDPWPTDFSTNGFYTGGFDLEAVGLINYKGQRYTSLQQMAEKVQHKVYPNPATNYFQIEAETAPNKVELFNLFGAKVQEWNYTTGRLDIASIPEGNYLLRVYFNQSVYTQIVQVSP